MPKFINHQRAGLYARIDSRTAQDDTLSANALAVITYLCSHSPNWNVQTKDLMRRFRMGRNVALRTLRELEEHQLLVRTRTRTDDGRIEWIQYFSDTPIELEPDHSLESKPSPEFNSDHSLESKPLNNKRLLGTNNKKENITNKKNTCSSSNHAPIKKIASSKTIKQQKMQATTESVDCEADPYYPELLSKLTDCVDTEYQSRAQSGIAQVARCLMRGYSDAGSAIESCRDTLELSAIVPGTLEALRGSLGIARFKSI